MTNEVTCRLMRPEDEGLTFDLVKRGFDEFVRRDCTQDGIGEFLRASHAMVFSRPSGHFVMVAESDGQIVGMIDVKGHSHICLLFVDSSCHRQGIGRRLVERATAICRSRKPDLSMIDVNSSLWAVPVYVRLGFRQMEPEQERNGIRFVRMVRAIESGVDLHRGGS
ncbi:MAG: GNAT family N-acetyltransferase [bacterium]